MNHFQFLRIQRGLSQKALAELLEINPVTVCRIERGWYAKPPEQLEPRLQKVFGERWGFEELMKSVPSLTDESHDSDTA
jgi:DNA-binding XRE family transcriptional regulator